MSHAANWQNAMNCVTNGKVANGNTARGKAISGKAGSGIDKMANDRTCGGKQKTSKRQVGRRQAVTGNVERQTVETCSNLQVVRASSKRRDGKR